MKNSLVGARYRDKPERIAESLTDLQVAMRGLGPQAGSEQPGTAQGLAAFARLCSVFLRKLVIGDRSGRDSRLLDKTVMGSLKFRFQPGGGFRRSIAAPSRQDGLSVPAYSN